jgi:tetratricopeptide (TPR) repeat protein
MMLKNTVGILLLNILIILFSENTFAQTGEGEKLRVQISKESELNTKADLLIKLALFYPEDDTETERYLKEAYDISMKTGYRKGIVFGQYYKVLQLSHQGRYDEAIEECKKCISKMDSMQIVQYLYSYPLSDIRVLYNLAGKQEEKFEYYTAKIAYYKKYGPVENLGSCYHGIAGYFHHFSNHPKAIEYYMRAWDIYKTFDLVACANEKQNIGSEYLAWGNLDKAEVYLKSALQDQIKLNKGPNCFFCIQQIGDLYFTRQDYKQALKYYSQGKSYNTLPEFKAISLVSYAAVYLKLNLIDSTRMYLDSADKFRLQENLGIYYTNGIIEIDYNFYKYYVAIGNQKRALQSLKEALQEATTSHYVPLILKYSHELYSYLVNTGDSLQSMKYLIQYQSLQDSLIASNTRFKIVSFESEQEAKKKENQIESLQMQKAYQRNYYLIGMAFLLVISFGAFSRFRYIRKVDKEKLTAQFKRQLAQANAKALRAQMNPHFIFNCLNSINCFIIDQEHQVASEYLIKFSRLIRLIMENSKNETIPIGKELEALKLYVILEELRFENKFTCVYHVDESIDTEMTLIPPMLLQPFVENSIWHGLMHKNSEGSIDIIIKNSDSKLLKISIIDNGIGREKAAELSSKSGTHKSFGMEITLHRIEMMNKLKLSGASMQIIDLKDDQGYATGTRVDLIIPY